MKSFVFPSCLSSSLFLVVPVISKSAKSYIHILDGTQLWQGDLTPLSDNFLRSKRNQYVKTMDLYSTETRRIISKFKGNLPHKYYKQNSGFLVLISMKTFIAIVYCCSLWNWTTFLYILTIIAFYCWFEYLKVLQSIFE